MGGDVMVWVQGYSGGRLQGLGGLVKGLRGWGDE